MIKYSVEIALRNLGNKKRRNFLTVLGIILGIIALVSLISIGVGVQKYIDSQFQNIGSNRIIITPGGGGFGENSNPGMSGFVTSKLYEEDVKDVKDVRGVENAVGFITQFSKVKFEETTKYASVFGIPVDTDSVRSIEDINYFAVDEGRNLKNGDVYSVTVGSEFGLGVFGEKIDIGKKIEIAGQKFEIVGIYKKTGNPMHDYKLTIPIKTAWEIFNTEEVSTIYATAQKGENIDDVIKRIEEKLRKERDVKKGEEDFSVASSSQMIASFSQIFLMVQLVMIGIGGIAFVVSGIGIMSTTYTSVIERTKEIGIMKALGAKNSTIMLIFLIESGILGLIGGAIGTFIGLIISKLVEIAAADAGYELLKAYISPELILGALLFSFVIGAISGLAPARRASRMIVVEALRK